MIIRQFRCPLQHLVSYAQQRCARVINGRAALCPSLPLLAAGLIRLLGYSICTQHPPFDIFMAYFKISF